MTTFLMSDLHLDASKPRLTDIFVSFLRSKTAPGTCFYLLGDIFEVWVGDDDDSALPEVIATELRRAASGGVVTSFMHGNRDFLLGPTYACRAMMTLIDDPHVVTLGGIPTLLTHGDRYCTTDVPYQTFRAQSRQPMWQQGILAQPLETRRALAAKLRAESVLDQQTKVRAGEALSDVVHSEVSRELEAHGVERVIHGHTHRPNCPHIHAFRRSNRREDCLVRLARRRRGHGSSGERFIRSTSTSLHLKRERRHLPGHIQAAP